MEKINKLLERLNGRGKENEDINTHDNEKIKEIYEEDRSSAIALMLKQNHKYYKKVLKDYSKFDDDFLLGSLLDAINEALSDFSPEDISNINYMILSVNILKYKISHRNDYKEAYKRTLDFDTINSFENIKEKSKEPTEGIFDYCGELDPFKKIELESDIKSSNLTGMQKKILLFIIECEGKVTLRDIGEYFGFSKQNAWEHLQKIKENCDFKEILR